MEEELAIGSASIVRAGEPLPLDWLEEGGGVRQAGKLRRMVCKRCDVSTPISTKTYRHRIAVVSMGTMGGEK